MVSFDGAKVLQISEMCNRTCDALSQNPREVFYKLLIIRILRDICPLERGTNNLGDSDILLRSAAKILLF